MTADQLLIFAILIGALVFFIWNKWRYDIVAIVALLVAVVGGIVPGESAFVGFGHPAVVTVAAVLVLSRGLLNAGVVDQIARVLARVGNNPTAQVAVLTGAVALCSGFMNNVGALALLMPVAVWMSRQAGRSPALLLMPLAFGSLLGGMMTLIGTPPNIIIASYRAQAGEAPFGMFDFLSVGGGVTLVGVAFIALVGWRLTPKGEAKSSKAELFEISAYITEVVIPEESEVADTTLHDLLKKHSSVTVVGLIRGKKRFMAPSPYKVVHSSDILIVEADADSLRNFIDAEKLKLKNGGEARLDENKESDDEERKPLDSDEVQIAEAVISTGSHLIGQTAAGLDIRERYGVNIIAVARRGQRIQKRLSEIRFLAGDILLLQAPKETLAESISELGCLPLAERGLRIGKPRKVLLATAIFGAGILLTALGVMPVQVSLTLAAVVMVLVKLLSANEAYRSIDWPVIILLATMIPLGEALESTGGAQLVADQMQSIAGSLTPALMVAALLTVTMLLSCVINNAAAAILMAPIAIRIAQGMEVSIDPLLMAVAIGASAAFLTPIGHQSNAMVMEPGGYRFTDYLKLGLPLSILVIITAVPIILWAWPL